MRKICDEKSIAIYEIGMKIKIITKMLKEMHKCRINNKKIHLGR